MFLVYFIMFLHLRWLDIDERPYGMRAVNVTLSPKDYEYISEINACGIPYSDLFREAIDHAKRGLYREYLRHLQRSGKEDIEKIQVAENIDETLQRSFEDPTFRWPVETFYNKSPRERVRMCLRMTVWDLRLLKRILDPKSSVGDFLVILVRRMRGCVLPRRVHKKMTFGMRMEDHEMLNRFLDRYTEKYDEKLKRSEVVVFAYHLFKHMRGLEQRKILKQESLEGKKRGRFKKISVSFLSPFYANLKGLKLGPSRKVLYIHDGRQLQHVSYHQDEKTFIQVWVDEDYWKEQRGLKENKSTDPLVETDFSLSEWHAFTSTREPRITELRAALYNFLRQEKTHELIR